LTALYSPKRKKAPAVPAKKGRSGDIFGVFTNLAALIPLMERKSAVPMIRQKVQFPPAAACTSLKL